MADGEELAAAVSDELVVAAEEAGEELVVAAAEEAPGEELVVVAAAAAAGEELVVAVGEELVAAPKSSWCRAACKELFCHWAASDLHVSHVHTGRG